MRTLFRARRRLAEAVPLFGHYAVEGAKAITDRIPAATKYVERALGKGLNWLSGASVALNFNPTFGTTQHAESMPPRHNARSAPSGTSEALSVINNKVRQSRAQIPMGGLGAGQWQYYSEPAMHKKPRKGPPVSPAPFIPKRWEPTLADENIAEFPEEKSIVLHAHSSHKHAATKAPKMSEKEKRALADRARREVNKIREVPRPGTSRFEKLSKTKQKNAREFWSGKKGPMQQVI